MNQPTHTHHFIAGTDPARPPLVLLHGSGGNENDLAPLAEELAPGSPVLGVRGTVAIDGGFAFFHRLPDRLIDEADITERTPLLADIIHAATVAHGPAGSPIAISFSNGAIMAVALLLTRPRLLAGAILFRPLSPFRDDPPTCLDNVRVLIIDGEKVTAVHRVMALDGLTDFEMPGTTHPAQPHLTTDSSGARLATGRR